ncbi:MAG: hypothetical protein U5J64_11865 [Halobacteriales archaeon]|nr:hypothetical protein [Halobacteriales archaeon]
MDFNIDRRKLLKATGAGIATATVVSGKAGAVTADDLPGNGTEQNPYEISTFEQLLAIDDIGLSANYILTDNIEFDGGTPMTPLAFDSSGYGASDPFFGTLDGQGYEIRNLEIEGGTYYDGAGLFGYIGDGGVVKNLSLVNISVSGEGKVGTVAGVFQGGADGEIRNVSVTGEVQGLNRGTGGLVGEMDSGTIAESDTSATVSGTYTLGGVLGYLYGGEVTQTYATGDVGPAFESSPGRVSGFVGYMSGGSISLSFATGASSGGGDVGGFVGQLRDGSITKAYARGDVTGIGVEAGPLGGFAGSVGGFGEAGSVEEVYSTGAVTDGYGGGLIGEFNPPQVGSVSPLSSHANNTYWDIPASGRETSDGGTGLGDIDDTPPADQMTGDDAPDNMLGFDFENTWVAVTGDEDAIIGFRPAGTEVQIQATQPNGPGYPVFGWQLGEDEKTCIDRRNLGRGQEDEECEFDRDIERGGSRRELDRQTGRGGDGEHIDSDTSRRDRGRGSRRGNGR